MLEISHCGMMVPGLGIQTLLRVLEPHPHLLGLLLELPVHVVDALLLRGQSRPQVLGRAQFNRKHSCILEVQKDF